MEELISENWVKIEEAAHILGTSVNTIRRRIRNGAVKAQRVARPQGYIYMVSLPNGVANGKWNPGEPNLWELVETLRLQLVEKDRQIETILSLLRGELEKSSVETDTPVERG